MSSRSSGPPTLPKTVAVAALLIGVAAPAALAQETPDRPAFKPLRFEEDWSLFEPGGEDFWDPIKHVDLNADGSAWASFGGELRLRGEAWRDFGFNEDNDDEFLLARALLHADVHLHENFRVFVQGKSALATERDLPGGRRTLDVDELDLQNAFVDVILPIGGESKLTARVGRQELLFGRQRLVSPLPWSNTMRTWDAARLILEHENWRIDGFYSRYAAVQKYEFNDWQPGPDFYGVYATGKLGSPERPLTLDLYFLGLSDDSATFAGETGEEDRYTLGTRVAGKIGDSGFDYDLEGSYQFGEVGSADVSAYSFASQLGYTFTDSGWKPRLHVGFDYASGDDEPGDGDVETFNQLFPLGHAYFGYMDFVGRQNIMAASAGLSLKPHPKLIVSLDGHLFWRANDSDALYNAGGGIVRPGAGGTADEIGQEIDLVVTYLVGPHLSIEGGYAHFFAGDFIEQSGPGEDMDWFYLQTAYRF